MSIQQRWYKITLKAPVIFSKNLATTGQHITRDLIPGRVLLGLAARLYPVLGDQAWTAFHSGQIRFIDGLPLVDGNKRAIPSPRCLQQEKRSADNKVRNLANRAPSADDDRTQLEAINVPYITIDDGNRIGPVHLQKLTTMKTAVDSSRGGTPRDGHLFGYQALSPGQEFLARLDADASIPEKLLNRLEGCIKGERRIGASRTAEFGLVFIERVDAPAEAASGLKEGARTARVVLLSDLSLADEFGQPRLVPTAEDFGLPKGWKLDLSRTFIRTTRYDRYNTARRSHDIKRHVLTRGSTITFISPDGQGLSAEKVAQARKALAKGSGLDRQDGLGQFLLEPAWMAAETLSMAGADSEAEAPNIQPPKDKLFAFISSQSEGLTLQQLDQIAEDAEELANFCRRNSAKAPSKTQWSRIRRWARQETISTENLKVLVGGTSKTSLQKGWEIPYLGKPLGYYLVEIGTSQGGLYLSELAHAVRMQLDRQSSQLEEDYQ